MTDLLILIATGILPIFIGATATAIRAHVRARRHTKNNIQSAGLVWRT